MVQNTMQDRDNNHNRSNSPCHHHQNSQQQRDQQPMERDGFVGVSKTSGRDFFQIAGHTECFKIGLRPGTILKKVTGNESQCFTELVEDKLFPFVPKVNGTITQDDGQCYLEMQDLLENFQNASVMDIKMGCRTYMEEELDIATREAKLRHDMYDKMVEVDANEPTLEERKLKAITKPRYMIWRETVSSTASLGFRIEGMRLKDGTVDKDFKTTKNEEQICKALMRYAANNTIRLKYLKRLYDLKQALAQSIFFLNHELIGSSLLFVHSDDEASIWLIDFAKTHPLPEHTKVTHQKKWELGSHEDGYLIGIDNLIRIFESIISRTNSKPTSQQSEDALNIQLNSPSIKCAKMNTSKNGLKETNGFRPGLRT